MGVISEHWLEHWLGKLFPFSSNVFYMQQKYEEEAFESAIQDNQEVLSRQTSIKKAVKKTANSAIQKKIRWKTWKKIKRQSLDENKFSKDNLKNLDKSI